MADPIFDALKELVNAMWEQFPGADKDELSTRLIVAFNEADRLLTQQQPRAALALRPDGTPQVSIGPAVDLASVGELVVQPPTPIRDAAERLLQQLELRRTDPGAPLALLRAEIKLLAALAAEPPASTKKCRLPNDLLLEWLQQRAPWATWMRPGGCLESAHLDLIALLQDAIAAADVGVPQPEQSPAHPPAPPPASDGEIPEEVRLAFAELERREQNLNDFRSLRKSLAVDHPPVPPPASDREREELAQWLYRLADERTCNRRRGIRPHPSALTRAAALLRQPAPAPAAVPVAVAERPWEREGWLHPEGGWCWWSACLTSWRRRGPSDVYGGSMLPHWAIPTLQPPHGEEGQP